MHVRPPRASKDISSDRDPEERDTVTVEIKTGSRTIQNYLLSPLLRYRQETLRER